MGVRFTGVHYSVDESIEMCCGCEIHWCSLFCRREYRDVL